MVALSREAVQMCIVPEGKLGAKVCGRRGHLSAYRFERARTRVYGVVAIELILVICQSCPAKKRV